MAPSWTSCGGEGGACRDCQLSRGWSGARQEYLEGGSSQFEAAAVVVAADGAAGLVDDAAAEDYCLRTEGRRTAGTSRGFSCCAQNSSWHVGTPVAES